MAADGCRTSLDERPGATLLGCDLPDVGDHLVVGSPIHGADMAEELLEVRAGASFGFFPDGLGGQCLLGRHAAQQLRLQDVVARERLAAGIEHLEHAVRLIDVGGQHLHHAALVEHELGELAALRRVVAHEGGDEVVAHLQDALLRRRAAGAVWLDTGGSRRPDVGQKERLVRACDRQPRPRARPLPGPDCRQQAGVGWLAVVLVEVAQDAEQDDESGQPLEAVHDLEDAPSDANSSGGRPAGRSMNSMAPRKYSPLRAPTSA